MKRVSFALAIAVLSTVLIWGGFFVHREYKWQQFVQRLFPNGGGSITRCYEQPFFLLGLQAQNLLLNGSFEFPVLPPNTAQITVPTSWESAVLPSLENGVPTPGYQPPQDGQQWIALGVEGTGLGTQSHRHSPLRTGGTYLLTWFDSTPVGLAGPTTSPYS